MKVVIISVMIALITSITALLVFYTLDERVKRVERDLRNTLRRQQGMTLKYIKQGSEYVHTLMEGQLLGRMGLTPDMAIGTNLHEFYSKKDCDAIEQAYSKAWNGEITAYEAHLNGIDYFVTLSPVFRDGRVIEVIGSGVDISERKRAEETLHESLALRRTLIDSLEIGMVVIDQKYKIMALNRTWCQLFHIEEPMQNIIGNDIFEQLHSFFYHNQAEQEKVKEILANAQPFVDEVDQFEQRVFKRSYFPFYMDDELKGHIWAIEDMTKQKLMEKGIIETKEEAVKANEAKSEFLSRMSHELRTPLNGILGFSQLMEGDETLTPKQQGFVREIVKGGTHLVTLINDILDISAIEAGKMKLTIAPIRIDGLINQCVQFVAPLAEKKGITVTIESTSHQERYVSADNIKLRQIILNLLDNAIKYNRENGTVLIRFEVKDGLLFVHIIDSGIGIPVTEQVKIFEPFYRINHVHEEGTGIGLPLVSRLIHSMGGNIGLQSDSGEGSDFWISLPLVDAPAVENEDSFPTVTEPQLEYTDFMILYIEDNLQNVQLVKEIFATIPGIHLISAMTGYEGMVLAMERKPDLILLDLNLPDLNGCDVFARIKANPACAQTPIIAVSANAMPNVIKQVRAKGFAEYISKPIDIPTLLSTIAKYIA
ncbi:ATP-binding protein [Neobacillus sp. 19]|uniref:hybrid sensor histidine kinase/response regulator n=1 Tax=Neobacillus sp. 19 TaxID=3394458 RepID=UPI003C2D4900